MITVVTSGRASGQQNFASIYFMDSSNIDQYRARAFSGNDARRCPDGVRNKRGTARAYPGSDEHITKIKFATWNIGSLTGKSREIVDVMQRRGISVMCLQELKWTGQSAKELGDGYKLFYSGGKINEMELEWY